MARILEQNATDEALNSGRRSPVGGFAGRCHCGKRLRQVETGRPRVACSDACRRERDSALQQLRTRERWLADWLQLGRDNHTTAPELAEEIGKLLGDLAVLRASL
jgi:hypothetical protein